MGGRWTIPVIVLLLAVAVGATVWGYSHYDARRDLEIAVANRYQNSFYSLMDSIEKIEVSLAKALVANGMAENVRYLATVWQEAMTAQANLSQLPLGQETLMNIAKFLTQSGDYAYMLMRSHTLGKTLTPKEREQLQSLREQVTFLSQNLHEVHAKASQGQLRWAELERVSRKKLPSDTKSLADDPFTKINDGIEKFPTLIYDGPFSDHVEQKQPKGLTGPELSEEEAREKLLAFLPSSLKEGTTLEKAADIRGKIPGYSYVVRARGERGVVATVDISRKGGHILNMINFRSVDDATMDLEEAGAKATEFLASKGFKNMVPTYATRADNIAVIPFAPEIDDVLVYPDLIKVNVALDNGEVVGYEALGYVMSHHERDIPEPKISAEEARAAVSPELKISSTRLAIIPTEDLKEAFCYEFKGVSGDGEPYIVYVSAETGEEVNILKVITNEEGTTTI
ncbi:MAG: germination protein YpeB [Firmicutes bacterium]|nr:germination protein YpeB [Bacillota bacterium]